MEDFSAWSRRPKSLVPDHNQYDEGHNHDDEYRNQDDEDHNNDVGIDGDDADLRIMMINLATKMATTIQCENLLDSSEAVEGRHLGHS